MAKKSLAKAKYALRSRNRIDLLSFSPRNADSENQFIIRQLKKATCIFNKKDNNIALEGDYGTGKSSILEQLKSCFIWRIFKRPRTISFFAFYTNQAKNAPDTENLNPNSQSINIQGEIVKQLYFGEKANKTKKSGYKRIGKHYYILSALVAFLFSVLIISKLSKPSFLAIAPPLVYVFLFIFAFFITNILLELLSKVSIKNITANDLSLELFDKNPDFDQLIDLLVFYFDSTKRRIVIFEDLDRLDNPKIYEELRHLNFIINSHFRPFGKVKFIYAVRGDIFSNSSSEDPSVEDIRTKVFDLIIPVIPFLSKINYGSVFKEEYEKVGFDYNAIEGIEKILSRHSTDMRVLKLVINNMVMYNNIFNLRSRNDYRNCIALSVIRTFNPEDFKKLSAGNSMLDTILSECQKRRKERIKKIEEEGSIDYKIDKNEGKIWNKLKTFGDAVPAGYSLRSIIIDNRECDLNDKNILKQIYRTQNEAQIGWDYANKNFNSAQIKEIFNKFVVNSPEELHRIESNKRAIAEKDSFLFYDNVRNRRSVSDVVSELIDNGFVTEGYQNFIAKVAASDIDSAKRYIFNYIRGKNRDADYSIDTKTAENILAEIDNTDLLSSGLYNYDLFDSMIKKRDIYSTQLNQIIKNAKINIILFLNFFDDYCYKYKESLERENCIGLNESIIDNMSKNIPPIYIAVELSKAYPKETIEKVTQSSLGETNAKEVIYDIVVILLENPIDIVLDEAGRSSLIHYTSTIIKSEKGRKNLFKLYIANSISIENLNMFMIPSDNLEEYLDSMIININEQNINYLSSEALIKYIASRQLSFDEYSEIMKLSEDKVKNYIVRNIRGIIISDDLNRCIENAISYIIDSKMQLQASEIIQYASNISSENLIRMVLLSHLTKDELIEILSKNNDKQLRKINKNGSIIIFDNNKTNKHFAELLISHAIVRSQNSKNKNNIRLQVI